MKTFGTPIQFTTRCGICGLTIPYEESVECGDVDACRPCAAITLLRHGGSITAALKAIDAIPTPDNHQARGVLEIEAERVASPQEPECICSKSGKHEPGCGCLAQSPAQKTGMSMDVEQKPGFGVGEKPRMCMDEIQVGSKWQYGSNLALDIVISIAGDEITTQSPTGAEHGWLRDEFKRLHTRVCGPSGMDQWPAGIEP